MPARRTRTQRSWQDPHVLPLNSCRKVAASLGCAPSLCVHRNLHFVRVVLPANGSPNPLGRIRLSLVADELEPDTPA
jgi:hypothetical protein